MEEMDLQPARWKALITEGADKLVVGLKDEEAENLTGLMEQVRYWNRVFRLTAVTDEKEFIIKHILDSISVIPLLSERDKIIDIGSGAGFPGIVIGILRPEIKIDLAEASGKKCAFLRQMKGYFALSNVEVLEGRIESSRRIKTRYSVLLTRAALSISELQTVGEKLLAEDGRLICMKGPNWRKEDVGDINSSFTLEEQRKLTLPFSEYSRELLVFRKTE